MEVKSESEVARLCPTPSDPMDYSLPGLPVHGIFQARVLEWVAIAFSILQCIIGLKLSIQKTKIMASSPITSWQIDGETMEMMRDFMFLGSQITADGDCNHEIKRRLFLGTKVMTNLDSILKSRDITLPTKVHLVKAMVFQ